MEPITIGEGMIKLAAIDIDGTLLDQTGRIPPENSRTIQRIQKKGVKVILVTGRRTDTALWVSKELELSDPMIVHNGAIVCYPGGTAIWKQYLSPSLGQRILQAASQNLDGIVLHLDEVPPGLMIVHEHSESNTVLTRYLDMNPQSVLKVSQLEPWLKDNLIQIMYAGGLSNLERLENLLQTSGVTAETHLTKTCYPERGFGIMDILNRRAAKHHALKFLAEYFRIPRQEILAIGDNHNDLEMLEYAGTGIVMENGISALKSGRFALTASNNAAGVAKALDEYIL
jgi:Cof subfamily protein (haloacid dehalogenase superfamily)